MDTMISPGKVAFVDLHLKAVRMEFRNSYFHDGLAGAELCWPYGIACITAQAFMLHAAFPLWAGAAFQHSLCWLHHAAVC